MYAGIAQSPGALNVIDTATLTNVKTIPVNGSVHNVYVTPDGRFTVSGSVATGVISVVDTTTDEVVWTLKMSSGIRPMTFEANADGSTKRIFVQLSDYHGVAVVDWATRKEVTRWEHAVVPGAELHSDGLQAAPEVAYAGESSRIARQSLEAGIADKLAEMGVVCSFEELGQRASRCAWVGLEAFDRLTTSRRNLGTKEGKRVH